MEAEGRRRSRGSGGGGGRRRKRSKRRRRRACLLSLGLAPLGAARATGSLVWEVVGERGAQLGAKGVRDAEHPRQEDECAEAAAAAAAAATAAAAAAAAAAVLLGFGGGRLGFRVFLLGRGDRLILDRHGVLLVELRALLRRRLGSHNRRRRRRWLLLGWRRRCGLDSEWWRRRLGAGRRGRSRLGAGAGGELVRHLADRVGRLRVELVPLCLVVEQPAARRGGGRSSGRGGGGGGRGGGGGGNTRGRGACSGRCGRVVTPIPLAATLSFGAPKLPRLRLPSLLHLASSARRSAALPDEEREHKPAQAESHRHAGCGSSCHHQTSPRRGV